MIKTLPPIEGVHLNWFRVYIINPFDLISNSLITKQSRKSICFHDAIVNVEYSQKSKVIDQKQKSSVILWVKKFFKQAN